MKKRALFQNLMFIAVLAFNLFASPLQASQTVKAAPILKPTALVLVNSASANYIDFKQRIQPYLDNFGVPYTVLDIASAPLTASLSDYALIIIGHRQLDAGGSYLDSTEQNYIVNAVNAGAGLINFDNDLSNDGSPRYSFIQTLFGFGYGAASLASGVLFNTASHYITQAHMAGEVISTRSAMTMAGVTLPGGVTALVNSGTQPLLAVTNYGNGRAVQWGSYDWMFYTVKGPLSGLDDLMWRSLVWAARKPFVLQVIPPFVSMRIDDVGGPLWWVHTANNYGFIPWLGLFTDSIEPDEAADLSTMISNGQTTAGMHAFSPASLFYADPSGVNFSDAQMAANYATATAWFTNNHIPISKYVVPHLYQIGTNAFGGLDTWGVQFLGTIMDPGQSASGAQWMQAGPYRLYDTGLANTYGDNNAYYADYMTVPGHSEYNGKFFNCLTEVRDITGYDWLINGRTSVPVATQDGSLWLKRALDSKVFAPLLGHEYNFVYAIPQDDWDQILQGVTQNVSSYHPIQVSVDYGCQYARAIHNSAISSGTFDVATNQMDINLTGNTDMQTTVTVYYEQGGQVIEDMVDVPTFSGSTTVTYTVPGGLDHITITPNPGNVIAGATQQFTAQGFDASNNPLPNLPYNWSVTNGGGTIDANGLFTAGTTLGLFANTVHVTVGNVSASATVNVVSTTLDHFSFDAISNPQYVNTPFNTTLRALDAGGNLVVNYTGSVTLSDVTGTIQPATAGPFVNGVWFGQVTLSQPQTADTLTAQDASITGVSNSFDVDTMRTCPCSIWDDTITPIIVNDYDSRPIEVGLKFNAQADGYITGVRFYKGDLDTGTHVGHLWTRDGTLLGQVTFGAETASGWQQASFSSPVAISANTTYVVSYFSPTGYYANSPDGLATAVNNPPLRALANGEDGVNGVYRYDTSGFPDFHYTYHSPNYFVDVVYTPLTTPDTIAPVISNWANTINQDGSVTITWDTNEPATSRIIYGTIPGSLNLSVSDSVLVTSHSINLNGLSPNTTYYYRIISADVYNNSATEPITANAPLSFTTPDGILSDTTGSDFTAGSGTGACYVAETSNGELILGPALGEEFFGPTLPAGWALSPLGTGNSAVFSNGQYLISDNMLAYGAAPGSFGPERSLEFVATFTNNNSQHIGFGADLLGAPWAIFSTGYPGSSILRARSYDSDSGSNDTALLGVLLDVPHRFRIDWGASTIKYYVDGSLVATHNVAISANMRVLAYSLSTPGPANALVLDWMRVSPYASPCTFTSQVMDAGNPVNWVAMSWNGVTPSGTNLSFSYRTGNTTNPADGTWSAFASVANSGDAITGLTRYIQYQVALSTTDNSATPTVDDVNFAFSTVTDTYPPAVEYRSPGVNATDVPVNAHVSVLFNESLSGATVSGSSVHLRVDGSSTDLPAAVSLSGKTITLTPSSPLTMGMTYRVIVNGSISDLAGNPMGADVTWIFTTIPDSLIDTTLTDFGSGVNSCSLVEFDNGALALTPTMNADFSGASLPAGWTSSVLNTGGTTVVNNGVLTLDGALAREETQYEPGHSLEFIATFHPHSNVHVGFGVGTNTFMDFPFAIFSTRGTTDTLYATVGTGAGAVGTFNEASIPNSSNYLGSPHLYRIDWTAAGFDFYIDGILVSSNANPIAQNMQVAAFDFDADGYGLVLDWARLSPYATPCSFTSRVMDVGQLVTWQNLISTGSTPASANVSFETRSGNTAIPDASWSAWQSAGPAISSPASQYIQYRANLSTSDTRVTPIVESVRLTYVILPPVVTIGAPSLALTNTGPVDFPITVTGADTVNLTTADVTLNTTGTATGTVTVTNGSTSTPTVTISGITGDGTLGISIAAGVASDLSGNTSLAAGPSATFTVDGTGPVVSIGAPSLLLTNTGPVDFPITVTGAASVNLTSADVTLNVTGTALGTVSVNNGSTNNPTVTVSDISGNGLLGITVASNVAADSSGNLSLASGPSTTFAVDNAAPSVLSITRLDSNPTNAASVRFAVTLSENVSGLSLSNFDLTVVGISGASISDITGSGTAYTVTVDTGSGDGTVQLDMVNSVGAADGAGNALTGLPFTGESYTLVKTNPIVLSVNTADPNPTTATSLTFNIVFSTSVSGVSNANFSLAATGVTGASLISVTGSGANYVAVVNAGTGEGNVGLNLSDPSGILDSAGNTIGNAPFIGQVYHIDLTPPQLIANGVNTVVDTGDSHLDELEIVNAAITQLVINFDEDMNNPAQDSDPKDVTNPANYLLVRDNGDGLQTVSCQLGVAGDDIPVKVDSVAYSNGSGSGPFAATLNVNEGAALPLGIYRLIVCGTTSLTDLAGNELAGNGLTARTDFTRNFIIAGTGTGSGSDSGSGKSNKTNAPQLASTIPLTGFAPNTFTILPEQPTTMAYSTYSGLVLDIPRLGQMLDVVGVPLVNGDWDVTWLGQQKAGYLAGSAFPTASGNSVITAHVWDAYNHPGPFYNLKTLAYGDKVLLHAWGKVYTYEVRSQALVLPWDVGLVMKHEAFSWITLVTCENYNSNTGGYQYRRLVRAVLVSVADDK